MLYISRNLGTNQWGVKDTDDGIEERVNELKLRNLVLDLGLEIAGVEVSQADKIGGRYPYWPGMTRDGRYISKVRVWQDVTQQSVAQKKNFVLRGVDIRTSGRTITSISWDAERIAEGTRIRLSDFGSILEGYALQGAPMLRHVVYIVLDDKIKVKKNSFKNAFARNLIFDLREVTNERTAQYVYEQAIHGRGQGYEESIIDTKKRTEYWSVMDVVIRGFPQDFTWSDEVGYEVGKFWLKEFKEVANAPLELSVKEDDKVRFKAHISHIKSDEIFWRSNCQDYDTVRYNDYDDIFSLLTLCVRINWYKANRFKNYIQYIKPSEDVKQVYVFMCNRINNWLLDISQGEGSI